MTLRPARAGVACALISGCGSTPCSLPPISVETGASRGVVEDTVRSFFAAVDQGALCVAHVRANQDAESHYNALTRTVVVQAPEGQATDALERELLATLCLAYDRQNASGRASFWSDGGEADSSDARRAFVDACAFGPAPIALFGDRTCDGRVQRAADTVLRDTYVHAEVPESPVTLVPLGRVEVPEAGLDSVVVVLAHEDGVLTVSVQADSGGAIQSFAEVAPGVFEPRWSDADILPFIPGPEVAFDQRGWMSIGGAAVHWDGLDFFPAVSVLFSEGQALRLFADDGDGPAPVDACPPQRDVDGIPPWSGDLFTFGDGRLGVAWIEEPGEVVLLEMVHAR